MPILLSTTMQPCTRAGLPTALASVANGRTSSGTMASSAPRASKTVTCQLLLNPLGTPAQRAAFLLAKVLARPLRSPSTTRTKWPAAIGGAGSGAGIVFSGPPEPGWVVVGDTTHTGAVSMYTRQIAEAGMASLYMGGSQPNMAYFGTKAGGVSTSPIAMAVPRSNSKILSLDLSTAIAG
ncbi:MAG TPA: hypothetical protein EYP98_16320, partial [Planctomycetes bacterium]|nr:hypothetical protein [Planctomycetota bacterium]